MSDIFRSSDSPGGKYRCIVEGDGRSVWMYLHDLERQAVIGDAPVCSLIPLWTPSHFREHYRRGEAPPLVEGYFSPEAVISDLEGDRIDFAWDDQGVTVLLDRRNTTRISCGQRRGQSKFIIQEGPWGSPWNNPKDGEPGHGPNGFSPVPHH